MFKRMDEAIKVCKSNIKVINIKNIKDTYKGIKSLDSENRYKALIMTLLVVILFAGLYIKCYVLDLITIVSLAVGYGYMKRKEKNSWKR